MRYIDRAEEGFLTCIGLQVVGELVWSAAAELRH